MATDLREVAVAFDMNGHSLVWNISNVAQAIPDSREFWEGVWIVRSRLGGIAHTHPWNGEAIPSSTDIRSFAGWEAAVGRRLSWWIVTFDQATCYEWDGEEYKAVDKPSILLHDVEILRKLSQRTNMSYTVERSDEEIDRVLNTAAFQCDTRTSRYRGLSYADGVMAAVGWLIGNTDESPFEEEDHKEAARAED